MSLCECWKHWEHSGDLSSSEPQVGHYGFVIDNYGDFEIGWFVGLEGFDFVFGSGDLIATVRSSTDHLQWMLQVMDLHWVHVAIQMTTRTHSPCIFHWSPYICGIITCSMLPRLICKRSEIC